MSFMNTIKDAVVGQAMKLAANPKVSSLVSDPRLMNAAMKAMSFGSTVKGNMDRAGRAAAGAFGLATRDEIATLRTTIETLEDQLAALSAVKTAPPPSAPPPKPAV